MQPHEVNSLELQQVQPLRNGAYLVIFKHRVGDIEVFRERLSVVVDTTGALTAVGGSAVGAGAAASEAGATALNAEFRLTVREAIASSLADFSFSAAAAAPAMREQGERGEYSYFDLDAGHRGSDGAILAQPARAKRVYFRGAHGLEPAYYVEVQVADAPDLAANYYAYAISAKSGETLFRHSQEADLDFTYRVWADAATPFTPPAGPQADFAPHPTGTPDGSQPAFVAPSLLTLQNAPLSTNDAWLADAATQTSGNNADAYVDLTAPDGYSNGDLRAITTGVRTFDYTYDTALAPNANATQQMAAVTQLFYLNNWLHDSFYDAGFDEVSGNAQNSNYGRGGQDRDAIRAEGQDFSGLNNANMATPADGAQPRMQMYVFTGTAGSQVSFAGALTGDFAAGTAAFGPQSFNVTADAVLVNDGTGPLVSDGCQPIVNAVAGLIAAIDRGNCTFVVKSANAQAAGAVGMLMLNNNTSTVPPGMGGADPANAIANLSVTQATGNLLKAALLTGPVTTTLLRPSAINRDGTIDNGVVAHEWGHYISNRLVLDAAGLSNQVGRGMGEGWADFHAMLMLYEEGDDLNGAYSLSPYALGGQSLPVAPNNAPYYGLRRYPMSRDFAKNPLTFRHIQDGQALPPAPPPGPGGGPNSEVHNTGEVWAAMLWQCYSALLNDTPRLTFAQANERMRRYHVAGYKLTPFAPTLTEARDALLAGIYAQDQQDYALCAQGFAIRGAGTGAVSPDRFDTTNTGVVESFTFGGAAALEVLGLNDEPGFCDRDGLLDSGETGALAFSVRNQGFQSLSATSATVSSPTTGVAFPSGTAIPIPSSVPYQTVQAIVPVSLSGFATTGEIQVDLAVNDPGLATPAVASFVVRVHGDEVANANSTDTVESRNVVWTTALQLSQQAFFRWSRFELDASDHVLLGPDVGEANVTWLISPPLTVAASGSLGFTFRHRHSFEAPDWDGGVIEISTNGGATWTDIGASATPTYSGPLTAASGNPLGGRNAYRATNASYPAFDPVSVDLGTAYQGQTVLVRFGVATDAAVGDEGWEIDDIAFSGITNQPFDVFQPHAGTCFSVSADAGTPQTTVVLTAFPTNLRARVLDGAGAPEAGVAVQFSAPASGATATFPGSSSTATATTDAAGYATAPALTANGTFGTYLVTATAGVQSVSYSLANAESTAASGSTPQLAAASDSGLSPTDRITNALNLVFDGTCTTNDSVQLLDGASPAGAPVVCTNGTYSITLALAEGMHMISATFTRQGATSAPTAAIGVTVDRTAPLAPTITSVSPADALAVVLSGMGETGSAVAVAGATSAVCPPAVVGGSFACAVVYAGAGVRTLAVNQTDAAGNTSATISFVYAVGPGILSDGFEDPPPP